LTKKLTYDEAYKIARKKLHRFLGKKTILIVKNNKENYRAYYEYEYASKKNFFPILVKTL